MGVNVRVTVGVGLGVLLALAGTPAFSSARAVLPGNERRETVRQTRPLVIIIPGDQEPAAGAAAPEQTDGETPAQRAMKAAIKVRDLLNDSRTVEATLYAPDIPLFIRAAQEARIKLNRRYNLSEEEQIGLGKAAGAIYIAVVGIGRAADGTVGYDISLSGLDITSRKAYTDQARYLIGPGQPRNGDVNAVPSGVTPAPKGTAENALLTATNTLVLRLLNGPLADYGRVAPPPALSPATPATPDPVDVALSAESDTVKAAVTQSQTLLADGNINAAIVLLRRAVNQVPLNRQLRVQLAKAYLKNGRANEAASEVRRAITLLPAEKPDDQRELIQLLADAFGTSGNPVAARQTYEEIINAQPDAAWARLALAELLMQQRQQTAAEAQYRAVLTANPGNREAAQGMARLLAEKGDFDGALALTGSQDGTTRLDAVNAIFDEFSARIATLLRQNRAVWEAKKLSRETFYKDTQKHVKEAAELVALLKNARIPLTDAVAKKQHARRVLSASLLSQAANSLLYFLETGDKDANAQATLSLTEFEKERAATP